MCVCLCVSVFEVIKVCLLFPNVNSSLHLFSCIHGSVYVWCTYFSVFSYVSYINVHPACVPVKVPLLNTICCSSLFSLFLPLTFVLTFSLSLSCSLLFSLTSPPLYLHFSGCLNLYFFFLFFLRLFIEMLEHPVQPLLFSSFFLAFLSAVLLLSPVITPLVPDVPSLFFSSTQMLSLRQQGLTAHPVGGRWWRVGLRNAVRHRCSLCGVKRFKTLGLGALA